MFRKYDKNVQAKLEVAIDLDKKGFTEAALYVLKDLVKKNPDCKACRGYLGEIAVKFKQDIEEGKSPAVSANPRS